MLGLFEWRHKIGQARVIMCDSNASRRKSVFVSCELSLMIAKGIVQGICEWSFLFEGLQREGLSRLSGCHSFLQCKLQYLRKIGRGEKSSWPGNTTLGAHHSEAFSGDLDDVIWGGGGWEGFPQTCLQRTCHCQRHVDQKSWIQEHESRSSLLFCNEIMGNRNIEKVKPSYWLEQRTPVRQEGYPCWAETADGPVWIIIVRENIHRTSPGVQSLVLIPGFCMQHSLDRNVVLGPLKLQAGCTSYPIRELKSCLACLWYLWVDQKRLAMWTIDSTRMHAATHTVPDDTCVFVRLCWRGTHQSTRRLQSSFFYES